MKRFFLYLVLSFVIHITAIASFAAMQFLNIEKTTKKRKVLYIKPIQKIQKIKIDKPKITKIDKPNVDPPKQPKIDKPKIEKIKNAIKPKVKNDITPKPKPSIKATPTPQKSIVPKKKTEDELKAETFKKIPYFKDWSEERIKAIPLPPGLKSWSDVELVEKELNKMGMLPVGSDLGNTGNDKKETPSPTPIITTSPDINYMNWKEYKFENNQDIYEVRFYTQDIGFILTIDKKEMKIFVKHFPFDSEKIKTSNPNSIIEVIISEDIKEEDIKTFNLPFTQEDIDAEKNPEQNKEMKKKLIQDTIRQKELIEGQ
ncbi:MAG: hypothetical protein AABZ74_05205 [Cyanobacteriota bacterium]